MRRTCVRAEEEKTFILQTLARVQALNALVRRGAAILERSYLCSALATQNTEYIFIYGKS